MKTLGDNASIGLQQRTRISTSGAQPRKEQHVLQHS